MLTKKLEASVSLSESELVLIFRVSSNAVSFRLTFYSGFFKEITIISKTARMIGYPY